MRGRSTSSSQPTVQSQALPRTWARGRGQGWLCREPLLGLASPLPPPAARPPSRRAPRLVGHLVLLSQLSSSFAAHLALPCANRACGALSAADWLCRSCGACAGTVRRQCAGSAPAAAAPQHSNARLRFGGEESRGSGGPAPVSLPPLVINGPRLSRDTPLINDKSSRIWGQKIF